MKITCPHCGEDFDAQEPFSGFSGENGEIVEEEDECTWCEKPVTTKWKARVEFEFQEAV
jgi:hypothetical protein